MKHFQAIRITLASAGAAGLLACTTVQPPRDLVSARAAYERANGGPAQEFNPADMHVAKQQLDLAEASFRDHGDSKLTRDQAYVALRKAELAEVVGRTRKASQDKESVVSAMHSDETRTVALTSAELERTRLQLSTQGTALQTETARRQEAEQRAKQAAADLEKFATVQQEPRGMVITLSGSVLFVSGQSTLLPAAQVRLNDVAKALTQEDPLSKIVVEGHTDSQGSPSFNQTLSQQRAQSVRDYLVAHGIASDRIVAQGFGLTRAIADNTSAEGRASNRRVEIIVQPVRS